MNATEYSLLNLLDIADRTTNYGLALVSTLSEGPKELHLWQVILSRQVPKKHPHTSVHFVLATDEGSACAQIEALAFPEEPCSCLDDDQRALLAATATRIPLHIRGFGLMTF
jgi:hypothetical protein